jgi:ubiquinone/menaquinone biosynthesis C-methylase UbiE
MMMREVPNSEKILRANQHVHSHLVKSGEYQRSPHFSVENRDRVRKIIESIVQQRIGRKAKRLLDFGCGTGFIFDVANDFYEEGIGVDVTKEMLDRVDLSDGKNSVFLRSAEDTKLESSSFEMATAYSFLDHVPDYREVFREAHRCLADGGVFYSDLNPNRHFINSLFEVEQGIKRGIEISSFTQREYEGAYRNGSVYEERYGIAAHVLEAAEPGKTFDNGFDIYEVIESAYEIGFKEVEVQPFWYLGQATMRGMFTESEGSAIEKYLLNSVPSSLNLFKYLRFIFVK